LLLLNFTSLRHTFCLNHYDPRQHQISEEAFTIRYDARSEEKLCSYFRIFYSAAVSRCGRCRRQIHRILKLLGRRLALVNQRRTDPMFSLKQVLFVSLPIAMSIGTIPAISIGTGTATARVPISNRDRIYRRPYFQSGLSSTQPLRCSDQNNTLAISPDQTLGLVAYWIPLVEVINLVNDKKRQLDGFITPRSIIFSPDGKSIYISDSSTGLVTVLDAGRPVERNRSLSVRSFRPCSPRRSKNLRQ